MARYARAVPHDELTPRASGRARVLGLLLGVAADAVLADPARWHPVAGFGRFAAAVERRCYADSRPSGVVHLAVSAGSVLVVGVAVSVVARRGGAAAEAAAVAAATWVVLGGTSLAATGAALADSLDADDLAAARTLIPHLCGRDPLVLDAAGMARAGCESVAENTSDAVVGPLWWGALAGVPGLLGYRAVNTLDAMVGHRSPRYRNFGWAAARLDDAANWIPARLTALLVAAVRPKQAREVLDAVLHPPAHPSPNAGVAEAAFAAALGLRLGGDTVYAGRVDPRPTFGTGRSPEPADIDAAVRLSRDVTLALAALLATPATLSVLRHRPHTLR